MEAGKGGKYDSSGLRRVGYYERGWGGRKLGKESTNDSSRLRGVN